MPLSDRTPHLLALALTTCALLAGAGVWAYQYSSTRRRSQEAIAPPQQQTVYRRRSLRNGEEEMAVMAPLPPPRRPRPRPRPRPSPPVKLPLFVNKGDKPHLEILDGTPQAQADSDALLDQLSSASLPEGWGDDLKLQTEVLDWQGTTMSAFLHELGRFWQFDRLQRCKELSMIFRTDLMNTTDTHDNADAQPRTSLIPNYLVTLLFVGRHTDLRRFSVPLDGQFSHLQSLTLFCEVSINDCIFLLWKGQHSLESFEVHSIMGHLGDRPGPGPALVHRHYSTWRVGTRMEKLRVLTIYADCPLESLFRQFTFPELREVEIANSSPIEEFMSFVRCRPRHTSLEKTRLHCSISHEDQEWVETYWGCEIPLQSARPIVDPKYWMVDHSIPGADNFVS